MSFGLYSGIRHGGECFYIISPGLRGSIQRILMPSVLIVCTANICRSPMAMGILRKKVISMQDWRVESAGIWSIDGQPAATSTIEVLAERGISMHDHRSRVVTPELLQQFNLILTMESGQKEALQVEFPTIANRVYLVSEMAGDEYDISDPMGMPYQEFEKTAQEIELIFEKGLYRI